MIALSLVPVLAQLSVEIPAARRCPKNGRRLASTTSFQIFAVDALPVSSTCRSTTSSNSPQVILRRQRSSRRVAVAEKLVPPLLAWSNRSRAGNLLRLAFLKILEAIDANALRSEPSPYRLGITRFAATADTTAGTSNGKSRTGLPPKRPYLTFIWCGGGDLNPYGIAPASTSS